MQPRPLVLPCSTDRMSLECKILKRSKDADSATAAWFAELLSADPWFKDVVPSVREMNPVSKL